MKVKRIRIVVLIFAAGFIFSGCKKDEQKDNAGNVVVHGTNRLIVSVYHHTIALQGISIFLKNNATEFPGTDTTLYNWKTTSDNSGIAVFENLFPGNYFLFGSGIDQNISMQVIGAAPAALNSTTLTNNEAYITLYVTE